MLSRAELERAARGTGCTFGGFDGRYHVGECPSNRAAVHLLDRLAWIDSRRPEIGELAREVSSGAKNDRDAARMIHAWVRAHVPFVPEDVETFRNPAEALELGGDCDDSARLVAALARALAIPAELVFLEQTFAADDHVVARIAGRWAECTIPARFGEHPYAAARRLGVSSSSARRRDGLAGIGAQIVKVSPPSPRDREAREVMLRVWSDELPPPTPYALQAAGAWARLESFYGSASGWAKKSPALATSHNWGAVQCTKESPFCGMSTDKNPDGSSFPVGFRIYPTDEAGAADFLRHLYVHRPGVAAVARAEGSALDFVTAMHRSSYFGGFCPEAVKRFGPLASQWSHVPKRGRPYPSPEAEEAGEACDREIRELAAAALVAHARAIADAHGEPLAIPSSSGTAWAIGIGAGALALGGGLAVQWYRRGWPWGRR